jgi:general secretion pathway protein I
VRHSSPDRAAGFSLIEVLVALAIVGLTLGAGAMVLRNGIAGHVAAADLDAATALAEERIAAADAADAPQEGETHGVFADRFAWHLTITRDADTTEQPPAPYALYRMAVEVSWRDGLRQRRIALDTLRLARAR